jgi:hypothetical protein
MVSDKERIEQCILFQLKKGAAEVAEMIYCALRDSAMTFIKNWYKRFGKRGCL